MVLNLLPDSSESPTDYRESIRHAGEVLQFCSHLLLSTENRIPNPEDFGAAPESPAELAAAIVGALALARQMNFDMGGALADYLAPQAP